MKIYTWSHKYYNLRLPWELFRYSAKPHVQSGKCSKTKNARGARDIAFAAIFMSQIICWIFHLKEKQTMFCIIRWRMTTEKRARAVGILWQGAGIQVSRFSRECLQIPVSCWQMSQFTINQTELIIFRSPGISDAGIQWSVAYTDGQRNRYALL